MPELKNPSKKWFGNEQLLVKIGVMRTAAKKNSIPQTLDLRDRLRVLMERELEGLPKLLEGLEGKDRLDAILKLMPLVMPKVKPIHHKENEPWQF